MIPLSDENPTEITPLATVVILLANVLAWILVEGSGEQAALVASITEFGVVPCQITGECAGAGLTWGTVFTSMFLHGSWGHLIGNMVFLWVFGNNIEDSMGHVRFVVFYLLCGIVAALVHVYLAPQSAIPTVGASGAISGIMGAYILLYPRVRVLTWIPPFFFVQVPALLLLGYWFLVQVATGVLTYGPEMGDQGGVAVWAHVGGFAAGLVLIKLFEKRALTFAKSHKIKLPPEEAHRLEW
ncbi:MAG: rhomboid family intramembrane serine protease [Gemmatimonas sp.]|nr:rhomboid family intramembrane serine protease [Gemmatimonas sp.]